MKSTAKHLIVASALIVGSALPPFAALAKAQPESTVSTLKPGGKSVGALKLSDFQRPKGAAAKQRDREASECTNLHIDNRTNQPLLIRIDGIPVDILTPWGDTYFCLNFGTYRLEALSAEGGYATKLVRIGDGVTKWTLR